MVRRITFLLTLLTPFAWSEESYRFVTEFSKPEIFAGEQVRCNFVLYTVFPEVNIEVAKFPEFRGYWKENLILRQGKIQMRYESFATPPWRKVVVGSYIVSPMVGERNPTIEPMKLVFQADSYGQASAVDEVLLSQTDPNFRIKPLPPLPLEIRPSSFSGAVGKFQLHHSGRGIQFRKGEPALVRYILQGEGNFNDINRLRIEFPEGTEVLSTRSFVQGSGNYALKSFDWIVTFTQDSDFRMPPIQFTFFDPYLEEYRTVESNSVQAVKLPPLLEEVPEDPEISFGAYETSQTTSRPTWLDWRWYLFNALLLMFAIRKRLIRSLRRNKAVHHNQTPALVEQAKKALEEAEFEEFLRVTSDLTYQHLRNRFTPAHGVPTRINLVHSARQALGEEFALRAKRIFSAYDEMAFSPRKTTASAKESIYNDFEYLVNA